MIMSERFFPMLDGPPLPWPIAAAVWQYLYAALGHGNQSLERVGERGGFSYGEIEFFAKELQERQKQGRPILEVEAEKFRWHVCGGCGQKWGDEMNDYERCPACLGRTEQ